MSESNVGKTVTQVVIEEVCEAIKRKSQRLLRVGRSVDLADVRDIVTHAVAQLRAVDATENGPLTVGPFTVLRNTYQQMYDLTASLEERVKHLETKLRCYTDRLVGIEIVERCTVKTPVGDACVRQAVRSQLERAVELEEQVATYEAETEQQMVLLQECENLQKEVVELKQRLATLQQEDRRRLANKAIAAERARKSQLAKKMFTARGPELDVQAPSVPVTSSKPSLLAMPPLLWYKALWPKSHIGVQKPRS